MKVVKTKAKKLEDLPEIYLDWLYLVWRKGEHSEKMEIADKKRFLKALKRVGIAPEQKDLYRATYFSEAKLESLLEKQKETLNKFPYYAFTTRRKVTSFIGYSKLSTVILGKTVSGIDLNKAIERITEEVFRLAEKTVDAKGNKIVMEGGKWALHDIIGAVKAGKYAGKNYNEWKRVEKVVKKIERLVSGVMEYTETEPEWIVDGPIKFTAADVVVIDAAALWTKVVRRKSVKDKPDTLMEKYRLARKIMAITNPLELLALPDPDSDVEFKVLQVNSSSLVVEKPAKRGSPQVIRVNVGRNV